MGSVVRITRYFDCQQINGCEYNNLAMKINTDSLLFAAWSLPQVFDKTKSRPH